MSYRNRQAGHKWERDLAKMFRNLNYPHVVTTRSESKSRDNQGIDLMNKDERKNGQFPFNVQAKCTTRTLNYPKLLDELPKEEGIINVVLHRHTAKAETKFMVTGEYAILTLEDFIKLIKGDVTIN